MICSGKKSVGGVCWSRMAALVVCLPLGIGCGSKPADQPKAEEKKPGADKTVQPGGNQVPVSVPSPVEFAKTFEKAVAEGKVSKDSLTPGFIQKVARPRPHAEADAKDGYNVFALEMFLNGKKLPQPLKLIMLDGTSAYFVNADAKPGEPVANPCFLKLLYTAETGWKVDWFHSASTKAAPFQPTAGSADALAAVHCFLEPLLDGDLLLTEVAMSPAWRRKVADSTNKSDLDLGLDYSRGFLQQKIRQWRNGYTGFTLGKFEVSGKTASIVGEFTGHDPKKFTLKLIQDPLGEWYADDLKMD